MYDGYIAIYTVEGQKLHEFLAHKNYVWSVCISPDMKYFASVSDDGCSKLFSLKTYEELHTWSHDKQGIISGTFSPDGAYWATGDKDGFITIFDVEFGELFGKYKVHNNCIDSIIFSQDGSLIYSGSRDRSFAVIRKETGQVLQRVCVPFCIVAVALNHDGTRLLCSGFNNAIKVLIQEFVASDL
eukprot:TRINITY_DN3257_c1_g3_i1.p1 TRINITY_DN3257_c1_g3~~TRINITY_DN3257_c1_g3_i1.p1  ORF type:complete len:192 (+),score=21.03 TRINITY_DN3257_c1_g3_i1:22-576(+)